MISNFQHLVEQEQTSHLNLFTVMFVARFEFHLSASVTIFLPLLIGMCWCTF